MTSNDNSAPPRPVDSNRQRPGFRKIMERTRDRIDELAAQGYFENVPGSGKPLGSSVENNPYIRDDLRMAYRILANAGCGLPWMEERKIIDRRRAELDREISLHLGQVRTAVHSLSRMPAYLRPSRIERLRTRHDSFVGWLTRQLEALNRAIDVHNLSVPALSLQVSRMRTKAILQELATAIAADGEMP